ncbi:LysR substrate-binding domain-containing protein [Nisaea sediminum]|uniref:LysR substrate-binding domain-containing protein n=1 Tax=Nisaea sediminum TaxID=2775867 RepID=UPI0018680546|nr:LysR substrate-binding domain-containing protein [Nisaea sediminum]
MSRDLLPHLPVVLAVARRGGFAAAAKELGMSASAVSHSVRMVEDRLGLPLFARTTRSVSLTDWGQLLVDSAGPSLAGLDDALERLKSAQGSVSGLLRLTVAQPFSSMAVIPVVKEMLRRYPDLKIELDSDKRFVDIVAGGFDAGVRLGGSIDQDMKTFRLTPPFRTIMAAAPSYVERRGLPNSLEDLANHDCMSYRMPSGGIYDWELESGTGEVRVPSTGNIIVNDWTIALELALEGLAIIYMFEPMLTDELAKGRLVEVLPEASVEETGLFLYYPDRMSNNPKLRAFIDTARSVLRRRHPAGAD